MTQKETILFRLTELMFLNQQATLLLDDLYNDEIINSYIRNIQIDSPFQELLFEGVLSQYIVEDSISITFTVEAYFQYLLARVLQKDQRYQTPERLLELLKANKLKGLPEAVSNLLSFDVEAGNFERLTGFIDLNEGVNATLHLCTNPIIHSLQVNGVERTFTNLLEMTTENDWIVMLNIYKTLFEFHNNYVFEFLKALIDINPLEGKNCVLLGIYSLDVIDYDLSSIYLKRIEDKQQSMIFDNTILYALANWYLNIGNYVKALEYLDICLFNDIEILGEKHIDIASIYSSIAKVYLELRDFTKSLWYCQKSLEIRLNHIDNYHIDAATSLNDMGVLFLAMGDDKKALEYFEKTLDVYKKMVGINHHFTAVIYNNLGEIFMNNNDLNIAFEYFEKTISILTNTLGENHPDIAVPYQNIALFYQHKGDFTNSLKFIEKSLQIRIHSYGVQHPLISDSYHIIGILYFEQNQYENALDYFKKSLLLRIKYFGEEDFSLVGIYMDIGKCELSLKNYEDAIFNFKLGFKLDQKGGFPFQIAQCYRRMNEKENALNYYIQSAEIRKLDLGLDDENTKESISNSFLVAKELNKESELPDWIKELN